MSTSPVICNRYKALFDGHFVDYDAHPIEHMKHHLTMLAYSEIGGGHGGYNQDHEFFGYRQSI